MPSPSDRGPRRAGALLAGSMSALLAAALLPASPAAAAPAGMPAGSWPACAAADDEYCIEAAVVTPVDGAPTPAADLGLTASAATVTGDSGTSVSWALDGWDDGPAAVTGGAVSLTLRTGEHVPRLTSATARDLRVTRGVDGDGHHTLTVTGRPVHVFWTTGPNAGSCATGQYCGEYDDMADSAGSGHRFAGRSADLDGHAQDFVDAVDGAYLATDAQARPDTLIHQQDADDPAGYLLWLGVVGNPHLDTEGIPIRTSFEAWLPESLFIANSTTLTSAYAAGFDVLADSDGVTRSLPSSASIRDGGLVLRSAGLTGMNLLTVRNRPSGAAPDVTVPGAPGQVAATPDYGTATVTWAAPAGDGGSPVTGYRMRAFDGSVGGVVAGRCDAPAGETSCEISGLTDGDTYHVAGYAVNAYGESLPSARFAVTAGGTDQPGEEFPVPAAPFGVQLAPGARKLTATWSAPVYDGNAPVVSWTVRAYRTAAGGDPVATCVSYAPRRVCAFAGLVHRTRLYVDVTATTEVATGPASARVGATSWTVAGTPRSASARSGRGRITAGWKAPATDGGTAVTGYRVSYYTSARGGTALRYTTGASRGTHTTPKLKAGRTYHVAVAAVTAAGVSAETRRIAVKVRR